jgi:fructokinase
MIISCGEALVDCFKSSKNNGFDTIIGGSPLNVAIALRKAGSQSALLGNISNDQFGVMLVEHLQSNDVSCQFISRTNHLSGLMFVEYKADKSANYNFYGHNSAEINYSINHLNFNDLKGANCLHFGSFTLISGQTATSFATIIKRQVKQQIISIDINVRTAVEPNLELWREKLHTLESQAHILKASSEDLALLYNIDQFCRGDALKIMQHWMHSGVVIALITDANNGAYALFEDQLLHIPAIEVTVVDTVGAGDCFMAFFLHTLEEAGLLQIDKLQKVSKDQLKSALYAGIKAAAYTVSHKGAVFPNNTD